MDLPIQSVEYIGKAIENLSRALSRTPDGDQNRGYLLFSLGYFYHARFELLGKLDDLQKAIEYRSIELSLTPSGDPSMPSLLDTLGTCLNLRYQCLGNLDDLEQAIIYACFAFAFTPERHQDLPGRLANLAMDLKERFTRLDKLPDIEKALEYDTRALELTPNGDHEWPNRLGSLGVSYAYRFQRLNERDDLEKAIQYLSRAVDMSSKDHSDFPLWLGNLGVSYSYRFERGGELGDLDKAIQYKSRSVALLLDNNPELPSQLANIGVSHRTRFERLGELHDLEKAIKYQSRALALTPDNHPDLPNRLTVLGTSHNDRFQRLGEQHDIVQAILHHSRALELIPDNHPNFPIVLANLGTSHSYRFELLRERNDLDNAIHYQFLAVDMTPADHPDLTIRLANLAVAQTYRFESVGELDDLEKAIQYESRALALTSDDHPHLPSTHFKRAMSFFRFYEHTGHLLHLQDSLHSFRIASQSIAGASRHKFQYARHWARLASNHGALNPIEAYQAAIDLLPQFIWLGVTTNQRYEDLKMAETLAVDAAYTAILSLNYTLALEWLEHARCVIWNQNMALRLPLDQLRSAHPTLAARLQTVSNQLHSACSESRESRVLASGSMTTEQVAQGHRRLAQEYNDLLSEARALAGFEDFLQPMKANHLVRSARHGPIVVINCHQDRCDALLIMPEQDSISHLPLPNFTQEKARNARSELEMSLRRKGIRERGVRFKQEPGQKDKIGDMLADLWNGIVKPVLDFMGYINNIPTTSVPHITWCPTGPVSFLPLHAAGDYDRPGSRVFDYVISSYTPTLTALLHSTPSSLNHDSRVLAIGQATTPGHSPLPGTVREIECVEAHIQGTAQYSQLMDAQATTTSVLDAMEQHDWVHIACHAHRNVHDPTKSGLFLQDGTLDLAAIGRRSFKNKGLAVLSACQTATGDEKLPDEAIHLASGIFMAGYSSVIATMWSIKDDDAPFVADKMYSQLIKDRRIGNGEVGKALHSAVAELRGKVGEKEFGRWVPYIHIGT